MLVTSAEFSVYIWKAGRSRGKERGRLPIERRGLETRQFATFQSVKYPKVVKNVY